MYSDAQVRRLRLIKQPVDQGHPIGALAQLALEQLGALAVVPVPRTAAQLLRVALVGPALARRLAGSGRDMLALDIVACSQELDSAGAAFSDVGAEVLLLGISELDKASCQRLSRYGSNFAPPSSCSTVFVPVPVCVSCALTAA